MSRFPNDSKTQWRTCDVALGSKENQWDGVMIQRESVVRVCNPELVTIHHQDIMTMIEHRSVMLVLLFVGLASGLSNVSRQRSPEYRVDTCRRREALTFLVASASSVLVGCTPAHAFENKISTKYDDRPKRRGPQVRVVWS